MKKLITFLCLSIIFSTISMAQNTILVAPSDVVVTHEFQFNFNDLSNLSDKTFGHIVKSIAERNQILTSDLVCYSFCNRSYCTGYEGLIPNNPLPKPVSNIACDYVKQYFDSKLPNKKYILDWGQDGYYINAGSNMPSVLIIDNRSNQDEGSILRIYRLMGTNNEVLLDTQTIWVVNCPKVVLECNDEIQVSLDSNCRATIAPDWVLEGGPYKCYDEYLVRIQLFTGGALIDRDPNTPGPQLDGRDIGNDYKFTIVDTSTGNSCWAHATVEDKLPPIILFPDTVKVGTEKWTCSGRWEVPRPVIQECIDSFTFVIRTLDGDVLGNEASGYVIVNLPIGIQSADIIVTDASGNTSRKKVVLIVKDATPPNAICDTSITVSITGNQSPGNNTKKVFAQSFNAGSFDNCESEIWYKVIRIEELLGTTSGSISDNTLGCNGLNGDDDLNNLGNQVYFDDFTTFCCADVGKKILVLLRVFDVNPGVGPIEPSAMSNSSGILFGRFSDCIIEVEVQDKSVPTAIAAPPDMVVSCSYYFDLNKASDPNDTTFGRVVTDPNLRKRVVTYDKVCKKYCDKNDRIGYPGYNPSSPNSAPNKACQFYSTLYDSLNANKRFELDWGLDGYLQTACGSNPSITINDLRECGQGRIMRIISSGGLRAIQTIWFVDCDPFYIDPLHCNDSLYSDIIWPYGVCENKTIEIKSIDINPDSLNLGKPIVVNQADDNCALISIQYNDEILSRVTDTTLEIKRIWTVIDWCQYDPAIDSTLGKWINIQKIIANNSKPPIARCKNKITSSTQITNPDGSISFKIKADELNNGSTDDGNGKLYFKVIRMDELLGSQHGSTDNNTSQCNGINGDDDHNLAGNQVYFDDFANLCCNDLVKTIKLVLRVFDFDPGSGPIHPLKMENPSRNLYGRFSDCIVDVELKDNSVPTLVAPPNMVVSCSFNFDLSKATNPSDTQFGRIVMDLSDRKKVVTQDIVCHNFCKKNTKSGYPGFIQTNQIPKPAPNLACEYYNQLYDTLQPDKKHELEWGMDGSITNTCGTTSSVSIKINDLRECGQGKIQREITAIGPNNSRYTRIQTIWVVDCDPFCNCIPFRIDTGHCNDSLFSDIIWPIGACENIPVEISGCSPDLSPNNTNLGKPIIVKHAKGYCSTISINYRDEITIINNSSTEIKRTWTIIDNCKYNPAIDSNYGKWSNIQRIISKKDTISPIVKCLTGIITVPMPNSGCIDIWAKDLDRGSTDNCTEENNLIFYFNGDSSKASIRICCDDFVKAKANDELFVNAEMWVEDEEGNTDYCKPVIIVQDIINVCPDTIVVIYNKDLDVDNALLISPNPSNGSIFINSKAAIDKINVISFTGILYSSFEVNDHHTLTISDLRSGLYFIESIKDGKKIKSKKVIVFNE